MSPRSRLRFAMLWLALFGSAVILSARSTAAQEAPSCELGAYDVNEDGYLAIDDIWVWERFLEASDPRADLNGDGRLEKADVLDFRLRYESDACKLAGKVREPHQVGGGVRPGEQGGQGALGARTMGLARPDAVGGPDGFGYTYADSDELNCGINYVSIVGNPGATQLSLSDDSGSTQQLGFSFPFYGTDRTSVGVTSNGYLTFGASLTDFSNDCSLPNTLTPNATIAAHWDDLNPSNGGEVWVQGFAAGSCPGGRPGACFVAEYDQVAYFSGGGTVTYQVVLRESGIVEMQFQSIGQTGTSATTGIENDAGTVGLTYACNTAYLGQPLAVFFLPPGVNGCPAALDAGGVGVDPNRQLDGQVHLPVLNFQGQDDVCRSWIEIQYIGCDPSKAVLVTWGEPGFCPPQAAGPLKVECTGLLKPGSTWNMLGAQIPTGSKSGILFKFTAQQLSDIGLDDDLGFDDVVADLMCETLFFGVVGDSDDYRRFKKAYNEGLDFAGIDQRLAKGQGILAVEVLRHCPGDVTPGVEVSSKYNGIAGSHLGLYDPIFGGFGYYVPLIYAEKAGLNTVMYIQNGGLECSSVEIWFQAQDDCLRARICEIFTLAPGETYQWDASDCVGPDWQGSAWLRSSQELGVAVDVFGRDILMTYTGEPQPYDYVVGFDEAGEPVFQASPTTGEKVAYGPLIYSEYQGWDTGVQVQNLSKVVNAKVKVYFLDRSGDVITTLVDWICPRGSQTFFLPVVADLPGAWVGSIRIESQDWWAPGTNPVDAPYVVGVATLMKYSDVARTETQEALAYNLLPEHKSYIWQVGSGAGDRYSGVAVIAVPSLLKDLDGTGTTSELAIMNLVTKPGFTDFAIHIYDQNGLLDFVCQKLHDRQVEYIDLQTWGYVSNGFKGSAIISATFWEHEVFADPGNFVAPPPADPGPAASVPVQVARRGEIRPDLSGGPDGFGYTYQDNQDAGFEYLHDYIDITATGTRVLAGADDSLVTGLPIGFGFDYYGTTATTIDVSSNGASFVGGGGSSTLSNQCPLPSASTPNSTISALWDDLVANDAFYHQSFAAGSCPYLAGGYAGACWIGQWHDFRHFGGTDNMDFELILLDDGNIIIQLLNAGSELGLSSTTGIENQSGTAGLTYGTCNSSGHIANLRTIVFTPPGGTIPGAGEPPDPEPEPEPEPSPFVRNLVGLGAVSVERTGTRLNEDVPGDETAGSRGIPLAGEINRDLCLGTFVPRCPGQPSLR